MSVFHSRTLNFPIVLLDFHPLPFLYSKGSDKYTFLCLHLQFGLSSTYGLLLMYPFFYVWPSYPSSGGLVLPFQSKSESSPPLSVTPGLGCVLLLCPEGFPVWLRGLFLHKTFQLPMNPGICFFYLQPPPNMLPIHIYLK